MKKSSFISIVTGFIFCTGFLFTACDSFLNGSLLKQQIEENIEYENAPSYTIRVEAEENTGTITLGSAGYTKKVTDYFEVGFKKNSGYKFIEWRAVSNTDGSSLEEYIEFTNKNSLETKCRLLKDSNDIKILPFCESQISFLEAYPEYDEKGKPRDSTIKIIFSNELLEDNDFSKIKISIDGSNVDANVHFKEPEYDSTNKTLHIKAKTSNRITVPENETKSILVTIPADFKYKGAKSGGILEIGEELQHIYRINSSTCDHAYVHYGVCVPAEDTYDIGGTIKISGVPDSSIEQTYFIGDTATVTFKPADGFVFDGWKNSNEEAVTLTTPDPVKNPLYDERGFCESTGTATATIEVINEGKVEIKAEVTRLPVEKINIASEYGKIYPNGTFEYKEGDKISVTFNADIDYQFINWKVFSDQDKTVEVPSENFYFTKADENNTTLNFKKAVEGTPNLYVEPICIKRPTVTSTSPGYDPSGVYRDRTIVLLFNKILDESSIYWTAAELEAKGITQANGYKLLKKSNLETEDLYYGYHKLTGTTEEINKSYVYKNIEITKVEDENYNLLRYFGVPAFDSGNPRFLRIPVNSVEAPPASINVLVTVSKRMGMKVAEINPLITLKDDCVFSYRTNGSVDKKVPEFHKFDDDTDFSLGWSQTVSADNYQLSATKLLEVTAETKSPDYASHKDLDNSSKLRANNLFEYDGNRNLTGTKIKKVEGKNQSIDLYVKGKIEDDGSGPASLQWVIEKINHKFYPISRVGNFSASGQIVHFNINGQEATVDERIVLSDLGLTEGIYKITLYAYDVNENVATKEYNFVWDETPPAKLSSLKEYRTKSGSATVSWTKPAEGDYSFLQVWQKQATSETPMKLTDAGVTSLGRISNTTTITNSVTDYKRYEYIAKVTDYVGNESEEYYFSDTTPPDSVGSVWLTYGFGTVTPHWWCRNTSEIGRTHIDYKVTGAVSNEAELTKNYVKGTYGTDSDSNTINMYRRGKQYTYTVYNEDWSGNKSAVVSKNTEHYVMENKNFTYTSNDVSYSKTRTGNLVINNEEIPYTELIPVTPSGAVYKYGAYNNAIHSGSSFKPNWGFFQSDRKPIKLSNYQLGQYEVTVDLWRAVRKVAPIQAGENSDYLLDCDWNVLGKHQALSRINWCFGVQFCNELSRLMGFEPVYKFKSGSYETYDLFEAEKKCAPVPHTTSASHFDEWRTIEVIRENNTFPDGFRYPTGAEWEFAARGADPSSDAWYYWYGSYNSLKDYGWYKDNSDSKVHPVGGKSPNAAGFYDIYGNVAELTNDRWCSNEYWFDSTSDAAQTVGDYLVNPCHTDGTKYEHLRIGGNYGDSYDDCRYYQNGKSWNDGNPSNMQNYFGMRLCRTVKE